MSPHPPVSLRRFRTARPGGRALQKGTPPERAAQVCRPYGWNGFPTVGDREGRPYICLKPDGRVRVPQGVSQRRFRTARRVVAPYKWRVPPLRAATWGRPYGE